ncbi:MAG: M13 family metallopeptidase [Bacteroidetes bacterium]|nr:M13 family metallopeptidase [Bacteroidota bacterium]MBU1679996.1 M13 family metallopeptidase [Bacteroidota bacterium]
MKRFFYLICLITAALFVVGCASKKGFETTNLDASIKPQEDFYHYANGGWLVQNPIPDDQSIWATFTILRELTNDQVQTLVLEASQNRGAEGSMSQKVGDFYKAGLDSAKIDAEGIAPLKSELDRIERIQTKGDLIKEIAHMHKYSASPLFFFFSTVDAKNSEMVIATIWQGGLGLPDRDYYLNNDTRSKEIRDKYVKHLDNMFMLLGLNKLDAAEEADKVVDFETRLAKASNTRLENRNPNLTYNKLTVDDLKKNTPGLDWENYLSEIEADNPGSINIGQPKFLDEAAKMINDTPLEVWKCYLTWTLLRSNADYLSADFVNERFEFTGKFLNGSKVIQPRWKRVLNSTNGALGEVVGQLYVEKYFPPEAKEKAKTIVDNLTVSMEESITGLDWMSEETKVEALKKLKGFGVKIGYPDKWRDYSDLQISGNSYLQNIFNSNYFDHNESMSKINKPVRKWEWGMTPQTVNAYYSPTRNEIVFPAAILQFPFYDVEVDDAINYGAMGAVIGHEITHGFDDQGRQYDADGNIRDWWTVEDAEKFKARAQVMIDQYNEFQPLDSFFIDGALTLGENIGDIGGLTIAYNAFKKTEQYKNNKMIDGFSPAQRFFLSWAQVWRNNIREDALKLRLKTDVHSPGKYRVLGPLSNMPEFFSAFDVKDGEQMRRSEDKLVKIW